MTKKLLLPGAAIAAALLVVAPSLAQPAPPAGDRPAPSAEARRGDPAEMAQKRADHLRAILQLTPAQEPALRAFMDAMKPPEGMRERMRQQRQEMRQLSTPERLDRMRDNMQRRQAEFDRRAMAIKRFYAQLTPAQQKAFDAIGPMHRGMGGKGHRGMGGHMGHGGHGGAGDGPGRPG